MKEVTLRNNVRMPLLGYGTFQITPARTKECVTKALAYGYRLIDTAAAYFNESEIGEAVKASDIPREELFLTTKLWVQDSGYEATYDAFHASLHRLNVDYIDLYLIHHPYGDYYGSWSAMEELYEQGRIKAIGVCNFNAERLIDLSMNVKIPPMVNQIECHPLFQQEETIRIAKEISCQCEAWGPLNEAQRDIFHHKTLESIALKHHKSTAQVMLRWHIQNQIIAIPKSVHEDRMKENMDIWDFMLDEEDMQRIQSMDLGYSEIIDHSSYKTAKCFNSCKIHEERRAHEHI